LRDGIPQFLTYVGMAAGVAGIVWHRREPRGALVSVGLAGVILSFGPRLFIAGSQHPISLPYSWLAAIVPGFSAMRAPQRFGGLATLAVVGLSALGLAALRTILSRHRLALAAHTLPWVALAVFLYETTPRGLRAFPMQVGPAVPAAYRWLAANGD